MAKRCPLCARCVCTVQRRRKRVAKRRGVVSVNAKTWALLKSAADERGTSMRALVEQALEGLP